MDKNVISQKVMEDMLEILIAFDQKGNILYGNRAAREKLDYTEEELGKINMTEIFRQEFPSEGGSDLSFDRTRLAENSETTMYRKNSLCFPAEYRLFSAGDGTDYLLAEDITLRRNMDVRLRNLKKEEKLSQQQRNEFIANVTHELRTPVNGIKGHVLGLLNHIEDEEQRRTLEVIIFCCDNMSAIINNILDFSKMEAGKFTLDEQEFDFYKMIDQVLATHTAEINKKELKLNVYIDESIPQFVVGDALRIGQILNNLLSNAVKFTLMGQISVDISKTMQVNDELELFFIVKDTGIGISMGEKDKLFQSFNQEDASITRRFGGTGLGLSITKQLVEMMNGIIRVESEKGKGSEFSFNIRLHTTNNVNESAEISEAYKKWMNLTTDSEEDDIGNFMEFGSEDNIAEIRKRMEKLVLSIELESWEKAEMLAESIKMLLANGKGDWKRPILRLEMAIRKGDYDKCMTAYDALKEILSDMI